MIPEPASQEQEAPSYSTEHGVPPRDLAALPEGQITGHLVTRTKYSGSKASHLAQGVIPALSHIHDHPVFGIDILSNQILKHDESLHEEVLQRTTEEHLGEN